MAGCKGRWSMDWQQKAREGELSSVSHGDVTGIYALCGSNLLGHVMLCPKCRADAILLVGAREPGCGKHFSVAMIRGIGDAQDK